MAPPPEARPASTVVLLRDSDNGPETLMLRRNKALMFAGGLWVFPGGAIDPEDVAAAGDDSEESAARIGAAREALEESGLAPRLDDMVLLSHWITPIGEPRRFATWIYAAPVERDTEVVIDGGEIHDACWLPVSTAVARHEAGDMGMLPPTYVTLRNLCCFHTVDDIVAAERASPVPEVFPVFGSAEEEVVVMFRGDAGYAAGDASLSGARHRAALRGDRWEYLYQGVDADVYPPLIRD
tara:strand:+ start:581 stop:1297 length:717 start_codon:yes stop_codon:yes gene_type:complete